MLQKLLFVLFSLVSLFGCRERENDSASVSFDSEDESSDLAYGCVFYQRKIEGTLNNIWETSPSAHCQFGNALALKVGSKASNQDTPEGICQALAKKIPKGMLERRDDLVVNVLDVRLVAAPTKIDRSKTPNYTELGPMFQTDNRYYHRPVKFGSCTFFKGWVDEVPSEEIVAHREKVRLASMKAKKQYLGEWKKLVLEQLEKPAKQ